MGLLRTGSILGIAVLAFACADGGGSGDAPTAPGGEHRSISHDSDVVTSEGDDAAASSSGEAGIAPPSQGEDPGPDGGSASLDDASEPATEADAGSPGTADNDAGGGSSGACPSSGVDGAYYAGEAAIEVYDDPDPSTCDTSCPSPTQCCQQDLGVCVDL